MRGKISIITPNSSSRTLSSHEFETKLITCCLLEFLRVMDNGTLSSTNMLSYRFLLYKGHFLAEEIQDPEHDPRFTPRGRTFSAGSKGHLSNGCGDNRHQNGTTPEPEEPLFIRRKNGHLEKNPANRFSFGGFGDSDHANSPSPTGGRSMSNLHLSPENGHTFRPDSVGTNSPGECLSCYSNT